jgi:hypothetical protein
LLAAGIIGYLFLRSTTVPVAQQAPAPFLYVDSTVPVQTMPSEPRAQLMQTLLAAKNNVHLSLGLVARLEVLAPSSTPAEMDAQTFLQTIAPAIPQMLLPTIEPQFLLGAHSYEENEAFLILKVDSYETAYAGMLAWEATIQSDLSPLFDRTPSPHIQNSNATTTPATTTPQLIQTSFADQVVENHDARVIANRSGDILLLWTFLDRGTIVITNNDATLREVISRLSQAPVISLPTQ